MVMYAETMLIPAIPDLIKDFHVSYSMSSWCCYDTYSW
jgi:hypothetical protein